VGLKIFGDRSELAAQLAARYLLFACPEAAPRIIYTPNAIEALNAKLRRAMRTRVRLPNNDGAMRLSSLVLNHVAEPQPQHTHA
jgi:putative transposase